MSHILLSFSHLSEYPVYAVTIKAYTISYLSFQSQILSQKFMKNKQF